MAPKERQSTKKQAGNRGLGRPKGAKNKVTTTLREAIAASFETLGGEKWLVNLAESDPKAYASLLARTLPTQVTGEDGGPVKFQGTIVLTLPSNGR